MHDGGSGGLTHNNEIEVPLFYSRATTTLKQLACELAFPFLIASYTSIESLKRRYHSGQLEKASLIAAKSKEKPSIRGNQEAC
eukprot:6178497-Pleurochrysis_carterae.AAC.2